MWDVVRWHDGTLSIAWWFLLVLLFVALVVAGNSGSRR
jgi:uncharacterized membrane protein YhaH (DUF805 family)